MDANSPETIISGRSTFHPTGPPSRSAAPAVRHARIVVDRMLRSSRRRNDMVQDRIHQAATVLNAAKSNETAFVGGQQVDVALRIATRLVRRREDAS